MSDNKYLYVIQCKNYVKFGISNNPDERLKTFQTGNPFKLSLLVKIKYSDCYYIEKNTHNYFKNKNSIGEWFLIDDEIKNFIKYLKNIEYNVGEK